LWKQETTVTSGSGNQTLATLRWFDPRGRVIKEAGSSVSKTRYDRMGRPTNRYIIAKSGDTSYGDVFTTNNTLNLSGDVVLEESQTVYDAEDGKVLMTVAISRRHDDTTTTGPLDTNADDNPLVVTAGNVAGRAQITSYWYDVLDRVTTSASYGTNSASGNIGTFDRATTTEPTISASNPDLLVSKTTYGTDGRVLETTDPMGRKQRREYDAAGRTVATIDNFLGGSLADVNRDADVYTRYQYFNGLQTKLWVDLDGDSVMDADDQVTTYVYGTSTSGTMPSLINTGHLLREVVYPEQSSGQSVADRTVRYAYNRLGEQISTQDQAGNVIETVYDALGREEARKVATLAPDFDGSVRRIGMVYDNRGRVTTVTQYDSPTGGAVVDQVLYGYDGWNNIDYFVQDVDGAVGSFGSGTNRRSFGIDYDYELSTAGGEGGLTRRTEAGYYRHESLSTSDRFQRVQYSYGASNTTNQHANRVESVLVATGSASLAPVAKYDYLGWGQLVGTELFHVGGSARTAVYNSSGAYADLDRFNRPTRWDWHRVIDNAAAGTFYNHAILYDNNSNIVGTTDHVHVRVGTGKNVFDLVYNNDGLNRLRGADQGNATGTGPSRSIETGTRSRNEVWELLSQTGNWQRRKLDADGDGFFTGETDRNELSAFNEFSNANEWKQRRIEKDASTKYDDFGYTYDKNGNLVYETMTKTRPHPTDPNQPPTTTLKQRAFVYDAFGRLRKVYNGPVGESQQIAEYRYNGLGFRTTWQYDADADGTLESSEQYHFMYDDRWRILATFRGFDENPKEAFAYHAAGFAGKGGSSYIDSVILRDADASTAWTSQASSTLNERRYYVQNWRADVVALLRGDGTPWEFIRYSAYGEATAHALADVNRDGMVNATDQADWEGLISEGVSDAAVPFDLNFDGSGMGDPTDDELFSLSYSLSVSTSGVGQVGVRSGNRKGYAGYEFDPVLQAYHVRHRVYVPEIGRWTKRDPLGYVDGMSIYEYCSSRAIVMLDSLGLEEGWPSTDPWAQPSWEPKDPKHMGCLELLECFALGECGSQVDGNDKFQHCYTACRLTQKCGSSITRSLGMLKELVGYIPNDSLADLCANEVGIDIGDIDTGTLGEEAKQAACRATCSLLYPSKGGSITY
jgi:RHS repeat-associated protein